MDSVVPVKNLFGKIGPLFLSGRDGMDDRPRRKELIQVSAVLDEPVLTLFWPETKAQ